MLSLKGSAAAVFILASVGCSSGEPTDPSGSGGKNAGGSGGLVSAGGTSNAGVGGGASVGGSAESGGGDGATCASASTLAEAVVPPEPIGIRFELLYDASVDDPANVASWIDFTEDCGDSATEPGGIAGLAPWGECVARHYVDSINAAFAELLGSTEPLLVFDSFTATPNPELARGRGLSELPSLLEPLTQPGLLNAFLVLEMTGNIGGATRLSQRYPDELSGAAVAVVAGQPWHPLAHEIGHVIGFPHVGGNETSGLVRYECCGGFEAEAQAGYCAVNLMCERPGATFDTCQHGKFLKEIAACWLSGQGGPNCGGHECNFPAPDQPPIAFCDLAAGGVSCTCAESLATFAATDCIDALDRFRDICDPPNPP